MKWIDVTSTQKLLTLRQACGILLRNWQLPLAIEALGKVDTIGQDCIVDAPDEPKLPYRNVEEIVNGHN
jgi:hypothetical protein